MKSSKLFGEAIADAKAVRATALANAKVLLEEAFTPKLKSMLSQKLKEELGEEPEDTGVAVGDAPASDTDDVTVTSEEIDQILKELDSDIQGDDVEGGSETDDLAPSSEPVVPPAAADAAVGAPAPSAAPATTPIEGLGDVKTVEAPALVVAPGQLPVAGGAAPAAPSADMAAPSADAGVPVPPASSDMPPEEDDEVNLEELLRELSGASDETVVESEGEEEEEGDKLDKKKGGKPWEKKDKDDSKEVADLKERFDEAAKTVEFLREQLNEVNLLNAKLLYTNKVFKAHALNNSQKMKIIEAFDLAKSVREVKLTHNNLSEALNFSKASKAPTKKAITEGFASQSTGTTKPADKIIVAPVNEMASRFQKLAGIKK
jgi:hypothetical protein